MSTELCEKCKNNSCESCSDNTNSCGIKYLFFYNFIA